MGEAYLGYLGIHVVDAISKARHSCKREANKERKCSFVVTRKLYALTNPRGNGAEDFRDYIVDCICHMDFKSVCVFRAICVFLCVICRSPGDRANRFFPWI